MLSLETILTFIAAAVVLSFVPGPDNLFVLTQSALKGWRTGVVVTLGLCSGLVIHTVAVALGVAVIFQTSQLAFTTLKVIGAAYLLYLAYRAFRATPETLDKSSGPRGFRKMYLRGVLMNVTNPKVAIFFLAFLPQFTAPVRGSIVVQMFALGALFIASAFLSFLAISLTAGFLSRSLQHSNKGQIVLSRIAGLVFVGLAMKLIVSQRQ